MTGFGQKETLAVIRFSSFEKTKAKNGAGYRSVSDGFQRMTNNEPRITNVSQGSTADTKKPRQARLSLQYHNVISNVQNPLLHEPYQQLY